MLDPPTNYSPFQPFRLKVVPGPTCALSYLIKKESLAIIIFYTHGSRSVNVNETNWNKWRDSTRPLSIRILRRAQPFRCPLPGTLRVQTKFRTYFISAWIVPEYPSSSFPRNHLWFLLWFLTFWDCYLMCGWVGVRLRVKLTYILLYVLLDSIFVGRKFHNK